MTFEELQNALVLFGLAQHATQQQIRKRYHQLVKECHPDRGEDNERIRELNAAYELIGEYLADYRYDFALEAYLQQYPEERVRRQFYDQELWARKD